MDGRDELVADADGRDGREQRPNRNSSNILLPREWGEGTKENIVFMGRF